MREKQQQGTTIRLAHCGNVASHRTTEREACPALAQRRQRGAPIHRPLRSNRHVAALLSSLWPGRGQLGEGARRSALLLAAPPLLLLGVIVIALLTKDRVSLLTTFLDPNVIAALLVAQVVLLLWRVLAVADAFRRGGGAIRERGAALTAVALVFVLVPSVYAAYLTEVTREAAVAVFSPAAAPYQPTAIVPVASDPDFAPLPSASADTGSPPPELGRFTVLLLGVDSGPGRGEALTDTMIVASLDPIAGAISMGSVPRDLVDLPLPDGRVFRQKINSLVTYANNNPGKFPGASSGEAVLAAGIGKLLGVKIDGWAQVNLPGFVKVIDSIGGVDVTVTRALCDARYNEYGFNGFAINPGRYHLDGQGALAYARIRKSYGESDFTRAARQGEIVIAARDRVVDGGFLNDPAGFIDAMGKLVETSLDPSVIAQYLPTAIGIHRDHMFRTVIQYPLVHGAMNDPRGSILVPRLDEIRALGKQSFPVAGTLPTGLDTIPENSDDTPKTKLPAVTCSAPAPATAPTKAPTPQPTVHATTAPTPKVTTPPATEPPATEPPPTEAPATAKPGGGGKTPAPSAAPPS
jgi:LCP family protein required for cell wall assembly